MIGMLRHNPTRFIEYMVTCAMGEDLFNMRRVVREKATAVIKQRKIGVPAALQDRLSEAPLEPSASKGSGPKPLGRDSLSL
jgi:hypothetical protein